MKYHGKEYRYSPAFDQFDPDGRRHLFAEETVASVLVGSWREESLEGMAWWVIQFVAERFCQPEAQVAIGTLLTLQKQVEGYLSDWMAGFQARHGIEDD